MVCIKCGQVVDDQDSYCRFCGNNLKSNGEVPWYYQSWALYLGIFVFGPLMLPLVFKNPALSQNKKIIITVIIIVYTCILLVLPALAMNYIYKQILDTGCY
jgi:hypothetical protein